MSPKPMTIVIEVEVVADQPRPRALVRTRLVAARAVLHVRRLVPETCLGRMTARTRFVIRARLLSVALVTIRACNVEPDARLEKSGVEVALVRESRRLRLPRILHRVRLQRRGQRLCDDLGVADLAKRARRREEFFAVARAVVAWPMIFGARPCIAAMTEAAGELAVLLVRQPRLVHRR